jgi:hypothetical protein
MAPEFRVTAVFRLLAEHGVEYLIVGGVGAQIQGAATTTQDVDIMPDPAPGNLERLARALSAVRAERKLGATTYEPRDVVDPTEFRTSDVASFRTALGLIDVLMELPGAGTFDALRPHARRYEWEGIELLVASLDDIIRSKETADRAKDWRAMDALYEARDRLRERPDEYEVPSDVFEEGRDETG